MRPVGARHRVRQVAHVFALTLGLVACGWGCGQASGSTFSAYSAFAHPTPVTITGYDGDAMEPFISKDGRYLFFNNSNDASVNTDLFYAVRTDDNHFTFLGPVPGVNGPRLDAVASLDRLGEFFFISTRSYDTTLATVYRGLWGAAGVSGVGLVRGPSRGQLGWVNFDAAVSPDGQTLWFDDGLFSATGLQAASIVVAVRQGDGFARAPNSAALLASINASGLNYAPEISADGLELFFTRVDRVAAGSTPALYRAARTDKEAAFGLPERVTGATGFVEAPSLSADGHLLYFHKRVNGRFVIYTLRR